MTLKYYNKSGAVETLKGGDSDGRRIHKGLNRNMSYSKKKKRTAGDQAAALRGRK